MVIIYNYIKKIKFKGCKITMKKLEIDLELLFQSFSFEDEGLCREFLDSHTGEILNVPNDVNLVIEGKISEKDLADWEREFLIVARAIENDVEDRYILIPKIKTSYYYSAMEQFISEEIQSNLLREKLLSALNANHPMRNFKDALGEFPEELEKWYDFEEKKGKEYVIGWLYDRGILLNYI